MYAVEKPTESPGDAHDEVPDLGVDGDRSVDELLRSLEEEEEPREEMKVGEGNVGCDGRKDGSAFVETGALEVVDELPDDLEKLEAALEADGVGSQDQDQTTEGQTVENGRSDMIDNRDAPPMKHLSFAQKRKSFVEGLRERLHFSVGCLGLLMSRGRYKVHSDVPEVSEDVKLAVAYIRDAFAGRLANGQGSLYYSPPHIRRAFLIQTHQCFALALYASAFVHSLLAVWEPPATATESGPLELLAVESFCVALHFLDVVLKMMYMTPKVYLGKKWQRVYVLILSLFVVDIVAHLAGLSFRFSRPMRPWPLLQRQRDLRRIVTILVGISAKLLRILAAIVLYVVFFAAIAVNLWGDTYNEDVWATGPTSAYHESFRNTLVGSLETFVLLTTESFPVVVEPAYNEGSGYMVLFVVFLYIGVFLFTSMILAVITDFYWFSAKSQIKSEVAKERQGLTKAFNYLDRKSTGTIPYSTWKDVLGELLDEQPEEAECRFRFRLLDPDRNGMIDLFDWYDLREVLSLHVDVRPIMRDAVDNDWIIWTERLKVLILSRQKGFVVCILSGLAGVVFAMVWTEQSEEVRDARALLLTIVATVFAIELVLSIISLHIGFWKQTVPYQCDFVTIVTSFVSIMCYWGGLDGKTCVNIAAISLMVRPLWASEIGRNGIRVFSKILPVGTAITTLLATVIYFYAIVGMEALAHDAEDPDAYYHNFGCGLGFESLTCSGNTLFQVVSTSEWNLVLHSTITAKGWSVVPFFISFYVLVVLILMNLLVAIVINAFFSLKKGVAGSAEGVTLLFDDDGEDLHHRDPMSPHSPHRQHGASGSPGRKSPTMGAGVTMGGSDSASLRTVDESFRLLHVKSMLRVRKGAINTSWRREMMEGEGKHIAEAIDQSEVSKLNKMSSANLIELHRRKMTRRKPLARTYTQMQLHADHRKSVLRHGPTISSKLDDYLLTSGLHGSRSHATRPKLTR